ncbi:MAG TPA: gephyrin-like molybdotransferase Glp [Acidimicrobiales bacterium]|nr:gephyrin-like molybdotransferase Glp [Acidimicrobiales bacterium]
MAAVSLEEARRLVLEGCRPLPFARERLGAAVGLATSEPVMAANAVPPFDNTAMDGYAVRAADTSSAPVTLEVIGTIAAGDTGDLAVGPGQAARIMTGAPIPPGADAVVMVERTRRQGDDKVVVEVAATPGDHVRRTGDDIRPGQEVVPAGTTLTAAHIGVLASVGADPVAVTRRATVGVLSTGDELAPPGAPLKRGQIRDSNRPTLLALLEQAGCRPVDLGAVGDDEAAITHALEQGLSACDALLTSGGVSVGDFDYVKVVLDRLSGGGMRWMQVAIRPAKPLAFGTVGAKPVFGLPGNPVSSVVSFELFARPALRQMMGHPHIDRPRATAVAEEDLRRSPDGKLHLVRVVASFTPDGTLRIRSAGGQGSHILTGLAAANALALLPDGPGVSAGEKTDIVLLADPLSLRP